jgi:predicted nucleic acid-binding protein
VDEGSPELGSFIQLVEVQTHQRVADEVRQEGTRRSIENRYEKQDWADRPQHAREGDHGDTGVEQHEQESDGGHGECPNVFCDALVGRVLAEYDSVLRRPRLHLIPDDAAEVMEWIRSVSEHVGAVPLATELPDPEDMPFLEVAASAEAILVTDKTRHYPKRSRGGVTVLTPREFLELLRRSP